ncbi:unnamed protein product [Gongylonema pulchrum]|uniref:Uncharacterized protein n=1 Tax=Gongylonema pulchrum TaxID=637853 RepID=A0A3P7M9C8_9BILA|nr:unnamed protein product [Gongylonema pulchrum]
MQMADVVQSNDGFKRPAMPLSVMGAKRARVDVVPSARPYVQQPSRTSNLLAPIMLLSGHSGEIYAAKFSPDGKCLASGGYDMCVFLWNVYGECENFSTLKGHTGAIMDVHFSSACVRKFKNHKDIVNSCHPSRRGPQLVASGSDDCTVLVHDLRKRDPVATLQNAYQITAVTFNDTTDQVIGGGIDNDLKLIFLAKIWDIRPFAPEQRCVKSFGGHQHNFEKNLLKCAWSPSSHRISCGSSDRYVYVWDVSSRRVLYKLPGHQGSVNATDFHPKEPIRKLFSICSRIY